MKIKELNVAQFDAFSKSSEFGTYYQSSTYALLMSEYNYDYEFIGYIDELGVLRAAALILIKKITLSYKYGYSPKGFLIDYFDYELLQNFTNDLKDYYRKRLVFIKINPEIAIGKIDIKTKLTTYNQNMVIRDYLEEVGFKKLKDNLYFESLFPRFNGILNLNDYNFDDLSKNTKNKIRKAKKRGLEFIKGSREDLAVLFQFIYKKKKVDPYYYQNYYNVFSNNDMIDLFLVKINFEQYLINSKELYEQELIVNNDLAQKLMIESSKTNILQKMNSDKNIVTYKNDIEVATKGLKENKNIYIAGALCIKYRNRVNILISGIDRNMKHFNANYFLHNELINYYKGAYKFLDLNGLTGDFNDSNPYKGLNIFKFGFKPQVYEFIGEFDLILSNKKYNSLVKKGNLAKEFNKNKRRTD